MFFILVQLGTSWEILGILWNRRFGIIPTLYTTFFFCFLKKQVLRWLSAVYISEIVFFFISSNFWPKHECFLKDFFVIKWSFCPWNIFLQQRWQIETHRNFCRQYKLLNYLSTIDPRFFALLFLQCFSLLAIYFLAS